MTNEAELSAFLSLVNSPPQLIQAMDVIGLLKMARRISRPSRVDVIWPHVMQLLTALTDRPDLVIEVIKSLLQETLGVNDAQHFSLPKLRALAASKDAARGQQENETWELKK